jgi:hypothetical protein
MTGSEHGHDHSHDAPPVAESLFSEQEWQLFRHADKEAAKRIVILMTSIFVVGIVLYSIVAATL